MPLTPHLARIRSQFPALRREVNGQPAVYFDGPAGTQCPQRVIDAVADYLAGTNSNHGGLFTVSQESDRVLDEAHAAAADLLGASDPDEIVFGANMTTLTFALSRAVSRGWQAGDEVIVTQLDHDANVSPWTLAARDAGVTVRTAPMNTADGTLDTAALRELINGRTRLVAVGLASNSTGSINPVKEITQWAHDAGAVVYADAVHFAPHAKIDVEDLGCDFLACSAYKFFGPHVGILWGQPVSRSAARCGGRVVSVVTDPSQRLGRHVAADQSLSRRAALEAAYAAISSYESALIWRLIDALAEIPAVTVWGITGRERAAERLPTISITHAAVTSTELTKRLAAEGIFTWNGHYYAVGVTEAFGLEPEGMVRIGLAHYNTAEEVDRLVEVLSGVR